MVSKSAQLPLSVLEDRLRFVHEALKLKQPSPEADAAMKRIALRAVEAYEAALREHGAC